jgi:hypothetical protein
MVMHLEEKPLKLPRTWLKVSALIGKSFRKLLKHGRLLKGLIPELYLFQKTWFMAMARYWDCI